MEVPQGRFVLTRPDANDRSPLRAWDAADEMLLRHLADHDLDRPDGPGAGTTGGAGTIVIVGDGWGALSAALVDLHPTVVLDSHISRRSTVANLAGNGLDIDSVTTCSPLDPMPPRVDLAVVKVPRDRAPLEDVLHRLAPSLHPGTVVVGAGMVRDVHSATVTAFEDLIGPTRTTRAFRKARLLLTEVDPAREVGPSRWPRTVHQDPPGLDVTAHAGVFGGRRLDDGTALLLDHVPPAGEHERAVDLGCGTGVVGAVLARRDPDLALTFVDDSARAVASARATFSAACGDDRPARFSVGDALEDLDDGPLGPVDLVVVNPPFHRGRAEGDSTAWRMFAQARHALTPGGVVLAVGNRHLAHHAKLRRLFGNDRVEVAASDPRFVVLRATAPG